MLPPPPPPPPATPPAALSVAAPQAEAAAAARANAASPGTAARPVLNLSALGDRLGGAWEKFKDLGAEAPSAPAPVNDDHLYADGAVFGAWHVLR